MNKLEKILWAVGIFFVCIFLLGNLIAKGLWEMAKQNLPWLFLMVIVVIVVVLLLVQKDEYARNRI